MTAKRLAPAQLPDWPRRMRLDLAAAYCGISPTTFLSQVDAGIYPKPIRQGRRQRGDVVIGIVLWDRRQLDEALDAEIDGREPSWSTDNVDEEFGLGD